MFRFRKWCVPGILFVLYKVARPVSTKVESCDSDSDAIAPDEPRVYRFRVIEIIQDIIAPSSWQVSDRKERY